MYLIDPTEALPHFRSVTPPWGCAIEANFSKIETLSEYKSLTFTSAMKTNLYLISACITF
jgi:hypothetical protein